MVDSASSDTVKRPGYTVTVEFLKLIELAEARGHTQAYLVREGLAMLLRDEFGIDVPNDIVHPQRGGARK